MGQAAKFNAKTENSDPVQAHFENVSQDGVQRNKMTICSSCYI